MTNTTYVFAHHPHDIIEALSISPLFEEDKTIFIANSDHLFVSENAGYSRKELVNGFDDINPILSDDIKLVDHSPLVLFVSTRGDGVYRSIDNGDSWNKSK